jgi:uncharacterized secreted protein with C-terminal beta-propeller domain
MRRLVLLALLVAVAVAAGSTVEGSSAEPARAAKAGRLAAFGSCGEYLGYVRPQAARLVGPYGLGGGPIMETTRGIPLPGAPVPTAAADAAVPKAGVDYSGTNVQEEGVDEPDLVKTDGKTLYVAANGRISSFDVTGRDPRLLDSIRLENAWSAQLLLHGDRLLVLTHGGYVWPMLPGAARVVAPYQVSTSTISEIDVSQPKALRLAGTLKLDGTHVAARLVGGTARIVVSSYVPQALPFEQPEAQTGAAQAAARERNQAIVASSKAASWLPRYRLKRMRSGRVVERPLVQCRQIRRPAAFSGLGLLTVLTVDLAKGLQPVSSASIMTDGRIVYASPESLYVATERWDARPDPARPTDEPEGVKTAIHKFDISDPERAVYRGSGSVSGFLLSQWSLSEHRGVLRVVSTDAPAWWGVGERESESALTTLRQREGALVQAGRVGGLGKGERVYAVRFVGDVGYVVTFRQIDPLYTVDLADPDRPRVLGELKIPGYSAYLHPVGEDLLLGVGQDATEEGRPTGTQLSLFDVSDLRRPTRLHKASLGLGWSAAESDHHAFLHWPRTGLVVVPFGQEAAAFRVGRARGITEAGRIHHGGAPSTGIGIIRSLVVRDTLLTVSFAGVKSSSLATLAPLGWAALPQPSSDG